MDTRIFKIGTLSLLGVFCIQALSVASPDIQPLTPRQKYEIAKKQEQQKYYEYLEAITKKGGEITPTQIRAIDTYKTEIEMAKNSQVQMETNRQTIMYNVDHPPVVVIGKNRLSTVTFVDNAGNPYPIQSYVASDTKSFNVSKRTTGGSTSVAQQSENMLSAQDQGVGYQSYLSGKTQDTPAPKKQAVAQKPKKQLPPSMFNSLTIRGQNGYADGDLIVYLVGKQNAIHIFLQSSALKYDYQSNITVDGLTAMSLASISQTGEQVSQPSKIMMEFLNGTPPQNAESLNITLSNSQVWQLGKYFYIRTKSELQSPAYFSRISTATGYQIFKISNTSHVLSMIDHGMLKTVYINQPEISGDFK